MSRQENLTRQPLPEETGGNREAWGGGQEECCGCQTIPARAGHPQMEGLRASGALQVGLIAPVCASGFQTDWWVRSTCPVVRTLESTASPGHPTHPQVTTWVLQLEGSKISVLAVNFLFSTPQQTQYSQVTYICQDRKNRHCLLNAHLDLLPTKHPVFPNGGS